MPSRRLPEQHQESRPGAGGEAARASIAIRLTRYGLPGAILLAGVILAIAVPGETGLDALVGLGGVCACVVLLNLLLRLGLHGDHDRDREAAAREYFDAHGRWPDERRVR